MANEISIANNANLRVAATLNRMIYTMLHSMVDLRGTCYQADSPSQSGSAAVKVRAITPTDTMGTPGEVADTNPTALSDFAATCTVAKHTLRMDVSDLFSITESNPQGMLQQIVNNLYGGYIRKATDLITDLYDGFATSVGADAVCTVDDVYDAQFALSLQPLGDPTTYLILAPKQHNEFVSSLRGEGGSIQYSPDTISALAMKSQGYKGMWNGHMIFTSQSITTDGTLLHGGLYAPGAIAISEASAEGISAMFGNAYAGVAVAGSPMWVEFQRDASIGLTEVCGHAYCGVSELEDLKGVDIGTAD